jgi:hypothetical protein
LVRVDIGVVGSAELAPLQLASEAAISGTMARPVPARRVKARFSIF